MATRVQHPKVKNTLNTFIQQYLQRKRSQAGWHLCGMSQTQGLLSLVIVNIAVGAIAPWEE